MGDCVNWVAAGLVLTALMALVGLIFSGDDKLVERDNRIDDRIEVVVKQVAANTSELSGLDTRLDGFEFIQQKVLDATVRNDARFDKALDRLNRIDERQRMNYPQEHQR